MKKVILIFLLNFFLFINIFCNEINNNQFKTDNNIIKNNLSIYWGYGFPIHYTGKVVYKDSYDDTGSGYMLILIPSRFNVFYKINQIFHTGINFGYEIITRKYMGNNSSSQSFLYIENSNLLKLYETKNVKLSSSIGLGVALDKGIIPNIPSVSGSIILDLWDGLIFEYTYRQFISKHKYKEYQNNNNYIEKSKYFTGIGSLAIKFKWSLAN